MISRFDGLDNKILNLKDFIIKDLKKEHLSKNVNVLERKVLILENDHNSLEQYGRKNKSR